jgi:hypothetical protein
MLMKLVLPSFNRMFPGGYIHRWFKQEGDWIDYGDNLLDVRVEECRVTNTIRAGKPARWLEQLAQQVPGATTAERAVAAPNAPESAPAAPYRSWRVVVMLRVNSSDVGYLRRIEARQDDYRDNGGLVAWLTTDKDEAIPEPGEEAPQAGLFRVAASMVDLDEE